MAMYLFASRLSLAVCYRRGEGERQDTTHAPSTSPTTTTTAAPSTSTSYSTIRAGVVGGLCRRAQPVPPPRVPTVSHTVSMSPVAPETAMTTEAFSPNTNVPSPKHRVRFANTFPRLNKKKTNTSNHTKCEEDITAEDSGAADTTLVYKDGRLVSGTLEGLVQHLTPTEDFYPDHHFLFTFLLCARIFVSPHDILDRVKNLWDKTRARDPEKSVSGLIQLVTEWSELFPYDFREEHMMAQVRSVTQCCVATAGPAGETKVRKDVSSLLQNLLLKLTDLERYEEFLLKPAVQSYTTSLGEVQAGEDNSTHLPSVLAEQLTLIELERLSFVGAEEFIQKLTQDHPQHLPTTQDVKKTQNLVAYIAWFNRLSYLVATDILKHNKKKVRMRTLQCWLDTAHQCALLGNFNSLMAILAGLNLQPVVRLRKTWKGVDKCKLHALERQMDPGGNFSAYRSTYGIRVPFFSLFLKDIYFLNQGEPDRLANGHINMEKCWHLAEKVKNFQSYREEEYCPAERDDRVREFLQESPVLAEYCLELASFECESPETSLEKERVKQLKSQNQANSQLQALT